MPSLDKCCVVTTFYHAGISLWIFLLCVQLHFTINRVISYAQLLEKYIELARNVTKPEENDSYPEKVRHSAAMRALYDNTGCDADLAVALHAAVMRSKMDRFRNDPVKERRIKRELLKILKTKDEVERVFKIIVEQEEY